MREFRGHTSTRTHSGVRCSLPTWLSFYAVHFTHSHLFYPFYIFIGTCKIVIPHTTHNISTLTKNVQSICDRQLKKESENVQSICDRQLKKESENVQSICDRQLKKESENVQSICDRQLKKESENVDKQMRITAATKALLLITDSGSQMVLIHCTCRNNCYRNFCSYFLWAVAILFV